MVKKPQTAKSAKREKAQKPKAEKKTPAAKRTAAAQAAVGHNSADPTMRKLFLEDHFPKYVKAKKRVTDAVRDLRNMLKSAKAEGFTKMQFEVATQLGTPEGEQKFREELASQTAAALYIGSDVGTMLGQLDLFLPSRTDATERAYDEGQKASIENRPAKPDYAPGTAQFESYMKGFHDHQAGIAEGFQSTDKGAKTKAEANRRAKADAPAAAPTAPEKAPETVPEVTSGRPLSRAEYNRLAEAEQSQFQKAN